MSGLRWFMLWILLVLFAASCTSQPLEQVSITRVAISSQPSPAPRSFSVTVKGLKEGEVGRLYLVEETDKFTALYRQ